MSASEDLSNWKGCPMPPRQPFESVLVRFEPIDIEKHGEELYNLTIADLQVVEFLWDTPPNSLEDFLENLKQWTTRQDKMAFVVINKKTSKIVAMSCLQNINPAHGKIEVGPIYGYARGKEKTVFKHEAALRILEPLMKAGYRRCEYRVWTENTPSMKGTHRIGVLYEGLFRKKYVMKGQNRDDACFSVTKDHYPFIKHMLEVYTTAGNIKESLEVVKQLVDVRKDLLKLPQYKHFVEPYAKTDEFFHNHPTSLPDKLRASEDLSKWKGCPHPARQPFDGAFVRFEPIDVEKHGVDLYNITMANLSIVEFLWETEPTSMEDFLEKLKPWAWTQQDKGAFVVLNKKTSEIEGMACLQNISTDHGRVEIGPYYTYSKGLGKTVLKHEGALRIMEPLFKAGYRRCEYKIYADNIRSLKGAQRLGLIYEGFFKKNFVMKGKNRHDAWFAVTDDDWPFISHMLDVYTAAENVTEDMEEIESLMEVRKELLKLPQYQQLIEPYAKTDEYFRSINII